MTHVFHPTDFSQASDVAFAHALKLALVTTGALTVFHYAHRDELEQDQHEFPRVRDTLTQWGLLPPGSSRTAVGDTLGIHVRKIAVGGDNPIDAISAYVTRHPADLMVLATHQRSGAARWLNSEVAAPLARRLRLPALFVPPDVDGFVDLETGAVRLRRIVVPVDRHPNPGSIIDALPGFIAALSAEPVSVDLLHVGGAATMPHVRPPDAGANITFAIRSTEGEIVEEILRAAAAGPADLLVLPTEGRQGFLDALRGSTTEQVVRMAGCPVLAVPADPAASATSHSDTEPRRS